MSAESELLDQILDAHGGLTTWKSFKVLTARLDVRGDLLKIKGFGDGLRNATVKINLHEQKALFPDFPGKDLITSFTPDQVTVLTHTETFWNNHPTPESLSKIISSRHPGTGYS